MGRKFDSLPALNSDFIECDATKRIFAVVDENADELLRILCLTFVACASCRVMVCRLLFDNAL